jgi:hypothetical protein
MRFASNIKEKTMEREQIAAILIEANENGRAAAAETELQMVRAVDQDGRVSRPFPICEFASVRVKGLRGKVLAEFKRRGFEKSIMGGQSLWIGDYNQSFDMKSAYARAYAQTLTRHGFDSWAESRLD